jgi:cell division protein FtsL
MHQGVQQARLAVQARLHRQEYGMSGLEKLFLFLFAVICILFMAVVFTNLDEIAVWLGI